MEALYETTACESHATSISGSARCRTHRADIITIIGAFIEAARFDDVDMMDLRRAGDVARARALGPRSELLYESGRSLFTMAQIAALTTEMESRHLRRRDLELMAGR